MIVNDREVCPVCWRDEQTRLLEEKETKEVHQFLAERKLKTLEESSLLQDKTLLNASFDTFIAETSEERANKQQTMQYVEKYKQGHTFNLWFYGNPGVGKSHLSMSLLKALSSLEVSCLFIDIDEMLRKIRGSFNDSDSPYTEDYFIDLLTSVDFLVLDDLGAETGNIDTNKAATDFTSRVLRAIINGRQHKSTIVTTNLKSEKLLKMYDPKLISRMMRNIKTIVFKDTKDKRIRNVGF